MAFLFDWSEIGSPNGSATINDGSESTTLTVVSDPEVGYFGGNSSLTVSNLPDGTSATSLVTFSTPVENVTFEIFDLDASPGSWDDEITVNAFDANGNPVTVNFSDLESYHVQTGNTVEANDNSSPGIEGSGAPDSITVSIPGPLTSIEVIFATGSSSDDGGIVDFSDISGDIACFAAGTLIETAQGPAAIEDLRVGALIRTYDGRDEQLRWIGSSTVPATGRFAPIVFAPGAIGNVRELVVSPQHRVLVTGWQAQLLFGEDEVLVAAKHLVNGETIHRREGGEITYYHLLFERHEIILSEGTPTESFHPGQVGLDRMEADQVEEVYALFPELIDDVASYGPSRVPSLRRHEGQLLSL
ncbi:Hint domain-containing protein [Aestuariibius sp. 2305UL40-4]|uniref:Hint domain-containing protein n=1 Tax=Aestuariibius violaceus TaxID=3234132 RepID=UPI00345E163A